MRVVALHVSHEQTHAHQSMSTHLQVLKLLSALGANNHDRCLRYRVLEVGLHSVGEVAACSWFHLACGQLPQC